MRNERDHLNPEPVPRATGFGELLVSSNALGDLGFEEWVFHPGMLFDSHVKWWDDQGYRDRSHEGLDLCLYRTKDGEVRHLGDGAKIPVMYGGEVIKVGDDFLGSSVYICHSIYSNHGEQLLTVYGHIKPDDGVYPGKVLREGDLLGTIAEIRTRRVGISPHVHISLAWIFKNLSYEKLDWVYISDTRVAVLLNPLEVIGCRYSILT